MTADERKGPAPDGRTDPADAETSITAPAATPVTTPTPTTAAASTMPTARRRIDHAKIANIATVIGTFIALLQLPATPTAATNALITLMVAGTAAAIWGLVASPPRTRTHIGWRLALAITMLVGVAGTLVALTRSDPSHKGTALGHPNPTNPPTTTAIPRTAASAAPVPGRTISQQPPAVRRQAQLTLLPYEALDLDTLDPDWNATKGQWSGHDISFRTDTPGQRLEPRKERRAATLPANSSPTWAGCVNAPYDDTDAAPRADNLNQGRAVCVTTSDNRYALLVIAERRQGALTVQITVWE